MLKWPMSNNIMWPFVCGVIFLSLCAYVDSWCLPYNYGSWHSWSSCTASCGGGTRRRYKESCVWSDKKWDHPGNCNEFCYNDYTYSSGRCHCSSWRSGRCCQDCQHIPIANCKPGHQACGGSPDNIKCTDCYDPNYSAGYGRGCAVCPTIANCASRHCTSPGNTICLKCYGDKAFFLRTHSDTKCERMCAWNNHYCWPGECPDKLTIHCSCASGFRKIKTSYETSCQYALGDGLDYKSNCTCIFTLETTNTPVIRTCDTRVVGPNGETKRAYSTSSSTACSDMTYFYGNFQPRRLIYDLLTEFTFDLSPYTMPAYIYESSFGVTDVGLRVEIQSLTGAHLHSMSRSLFTGRADSTDVRQTMWNKFDMMLGTSLPQLSDGQRMCFSYDVYGGGFLRSVDLTQTRRKPSEPVPYQKTNATRRLCYRFDSSPPEHCKIYNKCTYEPLQVSEVVTRNPLLTAIFSGWTDPVLFGGSTAHASGIESYQLSVHAVAASKDVLKVDTGVLHTENVGRSVTSLTVNLTSDTPKLYAIYLEVKDVADNVKMARRFVLFDDSSHIDVFSDKSFFVESASPQTNFAWQTHHNDICLNWTHHFYNRFYLDNPLFNPIAIDPSGLINGVYEQRTGLLPVSGTPNVYGIVEFRISWSLNAITSSLESMVPDFQRQHYCKCFNVSDGQTYTLNIRAVDIASNSFTENRTVHIDSSVPHINNVWLEKDGVHRRFVQTWTNLSKMELHFEALDPHSGIKEMTWVFGSSDSRSKLLTGHIAANRTDQDCPSDDHKCYCPDVGKCEFYQYTLEMNKLMATDNHKGNRNITYVLSINATNHALLSNIEQLDIFVIGPPPVSEVKHEVPDKDSPTSILMIVGIAAGGLVGFVIVILFTVIIVKIHNRRLRQTRRQPKATGLDNAISSNIYDDLKMNDLASKNGVYDIIGHVSRIRGDEPNTDASTGQEYINTCLKFNNI